jgi:hypothetical protein
MNGEQMRYQAIYSLAASMFLTVLAQWSGASDSSPSLLEQAVLQQSKTQQMQQAALEADEIKVSKLRAAISPKSLQQGDSLNFGRVIKEYSQKGGGGADTGGGNVIGSTKLASDEVVKLLNKAKGPALYILREIEFIFTASDNTSQFAPIAKKLFAGNTTIYTALKQVQIKPLEHGPCYDSVGNEVDGSAKDMPTLCFSVERLAARLNSDSIQSEILAIVIHELSHTVGTTEEEAALLQSFVKQTITNNPFQKIPNLVSDYRSNLKDAIDSANNLFTDFSKFQSQELCSGITYLMPTVGGLLQKNMNSLSDSGQNGIAFLAPHEFSYLQGALLKTLNAMSYCMQTVPAYQKITEVFKNRTEMSLQAFQAALYGDKKMTQVPQWKVRNIRIGGAGALKQEIGDIKSALTEIYRNL